MRLPAVAIAAAFACGIEFGLHPTVARNASSHILLSSIFILLSSIFIFISILVLTGIVFVRIGRVLLACVASILS